MSSLVPVEQGGGVVSPFFFVSISGGRKAVGRSRTKIRPTTWTCPACLAACMHACMPACLPACMPICLPACLPACLHACLPACLSACLPACMPACMSAGFVSHGGPAFSVSIEKEGTAVAVPPLVPVEDHGTGCPPYTAVPVGSLGTDGIVWQCAE